MRAAPVVLVRLNAPRCGCTRYSRVTAAALIAASSLSLIRGSAAMLDVDCVEDVEHDDDGRAAEETDAACG